MTSFQELNAKLVAENAAHAWLPNAQKNGMYLNVGDIYGSKGQSLKICLRTGRWKDYATGEGGSDLISLYAAIKGITQGEALRELSGTAVQTSPQKKPLVKGDTSQDSASKIKSALNLWTQGQEMNETPAEVYLNSRNLSYKPDMPLKYHPSCPKGRKNYAAMLALMTDIQTNETCGVHRTFIKLDGSGKADFKPNKMMLGRAGNAVVRLTADDDIKQSLGIVEGIENGLAILGIGWNPIWAALSSGGIANFPVLPSIETLTIFADHDNAGQNAAKKCAQRWTTAGRKVVVCTPLKQGSDWNDVVLEGTL